MGILVNIILIFNISNLIKKGNKNNKIFFKNYINLKLLITFIHFSFDIILLTSHFWYKICLLMLFRICGIAFGCDNPKVDNNRIYNSVFLYNEFAYYIYDYRDYKSLPIFFRIIHSLFPAQIRKSGDKNFFTKYKNLIDG